MYKAGATLLFLIFLSCTSAWSQSREYQYRLDTVVCYANMTNAFTKIKPPENFRTDPLGRTQETSTIIVNYSGFTDEAKTAFQYAVDIWESLLSSPVPINISANWQGQQSNVLGSAIWGNLAGDFEGGRPDTWYPVALAEKIAGKELNEGADIVANFNQDIDWYYGLDGEPQAGQFDLVTVVLHEIGHGLGFTSSFYASGSSAFYGPFDSGLPMIFDTHVEDEKGSLLLEKHNNGSEGLLLDLANNITFFQSPIAKTVNAGASPKLYAPSPWTPGSSISHLDEAIYGPGDINSLMSPSINLAEAIHDPGPVTLAMFSELGWVWTYIDHLPLSNIEDVNQDIEFTADIVSDTLFDKSNVELHYSYDDFETEEIINMSNTSGSLFSTTLPATGDLAVISYYISVTDHFGRKITKPEDAESSKYRFQVGPDSEPPVIIHTPKAYVFDTETELVISADVRDGIGLSSVTLHYDINGDSKSVPMTLTEEEYIYSHTIDLTGIELIPDTEITYTIQAVDASLLKNSIIEPGNDAFKISVTSILEPLTSYVNDFDQPTSDFIEDGLSIIDLPGFNSRAVHSSHPYENGADENFETYNTIMLRHPIVIDQSNHFMQFDEIVLVEPGDEDGFWDYIAVEGSTDEGKTWKQIARYDSRDNPFWLETWESEIVGDNSQADGQQALLKRRILNLIGNGRIKRGEEVLIRFTLFADQLVHGWGWMMDNLVIQDIITGNDKELNSEIHLFPNPLSENSLNLNIQNLPQGIINLSIFENTGKKVFENTFTNKNESIKSIQLTALEKGLYIVNLSNEQMRWTRKLIVD